MHRRSFIKRSMVAGLSVGALLCPTAAQARGFDVNPPPSSPPATVSQTIPAQRATIVDQGFQWGDAGIGAAGTIALLGVGAGAATVMRQRRAHRTIAR
jgi:hypothetical protein